VSTLSYSVRAVVCMSAMTCDAVTPYLRSVLGLMGITNVEFVYAEGMDVPQSRVLGIEAALEQVANLARHPMVCG